VEVAGVAEVGEAEVAVGEAEVGEAEVAVGEAEAAARSRS
jgi:hypothetical protein